MKPIRHILVAVKDPGAKSLPAVAKAAQLARACGASIELFHALARSVYFDPMDASAALAEMQETLRARTLERLERVARRIRKHGIAVSVAADWDFPAYEAIVRRSQKTRADLIVSERHAGRHLFPALLKLADWELLRWSPVPVLLVQGTRLYRRPAILAAVDPEHTFAKPARLDTRILEAAELFNSALRGTLHAVHAYAAVSPTHMSQGFSGERDLKAELRHTRQVARNSLARALRDLRIPPARQHVIARHPVDAIQGIARRTRSSIVVMGAISRSGLQRFLIGNTAERLLDQLTCDVLIVKPGQFATRVPRRSRGAKIVPSAALAGW
jgi:universal stress protein E